MKAVCPCCHGARFLAVEYADMPEIEPGVPVVCMEPCCHCSMTGVIVDVDEDVVGSDGGDDDGGVAGRIVACR
jgi:hypothetical protein